jgi:hypothetical protein
MVSSGLLRRVALVRTQKTPFFKFFSVDYSETKHIQSNSPHTRNLSPKNGGRIYHRNTENTAYILTLKTPEVSQRDNNDMRLCSVTAHQNKFHDSTQLNARIDEVTIRTHFVVPRPLTAAQNIRAHWMKNRSLVGQLDVTDLQPNSVTCHVYTSKKSRSLMLRSQFTARPLGNVADLPLLTTFYQLLFPCISSCSSDSEDPWLDSLSGGLWSSLQFSYWECLLLQRNIILVTGRGGS